MDRTLIPAFFLMAYLWLAAKQRLPPKHMQQKYPIILLTASDFLCKIALFIPYAIHGQLQEIQQVGRSLKNSKHEVDHSFPS
jgi:hypothetical protein